MVLYVNASTMIGKHLLKEKRSRTYSIKKATVDYQIRPQERKAFFFYTFSSSSSLFCGIFPSAIRLPCSFNINTFIFCYGKRKNHRLVLHSFSGVAILLMVEIALHFLIVFNELMVAIGNTIYSETCILLLELPTGNE